MFQTFVLHGYTRLAALMPDGNYVEIAPKNETEMGYSLIYEPVVLEWKPEDLPRRLYEWVNEISHDQHEYTRRVDPELKCCSG